MRVFLAAGEASGDAYGARLVQALDERGAFSPENLASDLVLEMMAEPGRSSDPGSVWKDIARYYGSEELYRSRPTLDRDAATIVRAVVEGVSGGLIDARRLRLESLAAVGGSKLRAADAGILVDSSHWGAVGIVESLMVAPRVIEGFQHARGLLRSVGSGLFVPIDFGYVNVKLAREARKRGWKVLYFVPPGSWRRDKQGGDLPQVTDAIVTPFPWSAQILQSMGARAFFFGHPLKQMVGPVDPGSARTGVAVLPGSRWHEIRYNLPVIAEAVVGLERSVTFAVAPNIEEDVLAQMWEAVGGGEATFRRDTYSVLKESRAAVVCSGTATLEAALCRCPTVVVYRGSRLMEMEAYVRRPRFTYISLPNILLDRPILPELFLWAAEAEAVRACLAPLLEDGAERRTQTEAFEELDEILGPSDCFDRTAELALEIGSGI